MYKFSKISTLALWIYSLLITPNLFATERVGENAPRFRIPVHYENPPKFRISHRIFSDTVRNTSTPIVASTVSSSSASKIELETNKATSTPTPIPFTTQQINELVNTVPLSINAVTSLMSSSSTSISEPETIKPDTVSVPSLFKIETHSHNESLVQITHDILPLPLKTDTPIVTSSIITTSVPTVEPEGNKATSAPTPPHFTFHHIDESVGSILLEAMWNCDDKPLKDGEARLYIADSQKFSLLPEDIKRLCTSWYSPSGNTFATIAFDVPQTILKSLRSESTETDASLCDVLTTKAMLLVRRSIANMIFLETCSARENDLYTRYRKYAGYAVKARKREGLKDSFELFVAFNINVNMTQEQCYTLDQPATSLAIETGKTYDVVEIANIVAKNFFNEFSQTDETSTAERMSLPPAANQWTSSLRDGNSERGSISERLLLDHRDGHCILKTSTYDQFQLAPLITAISFAQLLNNCGIEAKVRWPHHVSALNTDLVIRHGISNFNDFCNQTWVDKACEDLTRKRTSSQKPLLENLWRFTYKIFLTKKVYDFREVLLSKYISRYPGSYYDSNATLDAFAIELNKIVYSNLSTLLQSGMPRELSSFLKANTYLVNEEVFVDDAKDVPTTFVGKFIGFGDNGEALIQYKEQVQTVSVGGLWSIRTQMGDYKRSIYPWRCKEGISLIEPICSREKNLLSHLQFRIESIQESKRPYQKWVDDREGYDTAQKVAHVSKPQHNVTVWRAHTSLEIGKEINTKLSENRIVRMVEDKLKADAHFKSFNLRHNHATHADGRGFSWESDDQGYYLSFSMGYPEDLSPALRQSHLKVCVYGRLINKRGHEVKEEEFRKGDLKAEECLIPVSEWLRWPLWLAPKLPVDIQGMKERWEEEQKLKLESQPQENISVESFPEHSTAPIPLITPLPEEKKRIVEAFPQAEQATSSILATPVHSQQQAEQEGFQQYDGPEEFVVLNERNIWEVKRYDKVAEHSSFGKFFRDPNTNKWWSKDNAGHGGSAWKVFKETATGLKWEMDTDKYGDEMEEKHKSETGTFIPWKDLTIKK